MPTWSLLSVLTVAWVAVTVIFLSLVGYRSLVGLKEDDTLTLSAGESKLEEEQKEVQVRLNRLQPYLLGFGWSSAVLLAAVAGVWIYRGVKTFFS